MHIATVIAFVQNVAPLLALLAAVVRTVPGLVVSTKARSRSRTPSYRTIRVKALRVTAPWHDDPWPEDWNDRRTRIRYRQKERRWIVLLLGLSLFAAIGYGAIFVDDRFDNFIPFHAGNGIPAFLACVLFVLICISEIRFLWRIRGDHGLGETLYGASGSLVVDGALADITQYCLGALYEIGSKLVSTVECVEPEGGCADGPVVTKVQIVAATGFYPPRWMTLGPLQLISVKGEKITVYLSRDGDDRWCVEIRSDNMDPGVDEGARANARNVRKFLEAWAFFPDRLTSLTEV